MTARTVYALLLSRTTLSQTNGWIDEDGHVFVYYTIEELSKTICRSDTIVKKALKELGTVQLLERKRSGFSKPTKLYLKCSHEAFGTVQQEETSVLRARFREIDRFVAGLNEKDAYPLGWKTSPHTDGEPTL